MNTVAPADELDEDAIEAGRLLFAQACDFMLSVASIRQLPATDLPEIAFVGRSNVGKSTLINALTSHKQLARTSNTPGRTQQINLFDLGGRLILADLPGYGYANAPKPTVDQWHRLIQTYLKGRPTLRLVCLLIDARHGIKPVDEDYMTLLAEAAVAYRVVLTKADQIRQAPLATLLQDVRAALKHRIGAHPDPIATSARDQLGMAGLRAELAALALST
ncbi:MAG: YihA family ribosome biogenesis GTP-binding protein [Rhizobiales bacterium]|nr:YihA family ribosome biogenesis GTP-binding protein [Hyphomicrobiales bacterium]